MGRVLVLSNDLCFPETLPEEDTDREVFATQTDIALLVE